MALQLSGLSHYLYKSTATTHIEELDASLIHQLLLKGHVLEIHGVVQKVLRNGISLVKIGTIDTLKANITVTYLFKVQEDLSQFYGTLFALLQLGENHSGWRKKIAGVT